jgi:hypothetical protein
VDYSYKLRTALYHEIKYCTAVSSMTARNKAGRAALAISLWLAMTCAVAADRTKVLNIYAWAEYFPTALIAKFQSETGIHVNYAVLDSPETAETAGHPSAFRATAGLHPRRDAGIHARVAAVQVGTLTAARKTRIVRITLRTA